MTILERFKPDPIPAIHPMPEYLASGQRYRWYEDAKQVLQVPWMGVVTMAYTHYPTFFGERWRGLRPSCQSRPFVEAAQDPRIRIEPPEAVSNVYGMACPLMMAMPAAFSIAARFPDSFEDAMLTAINSGGNNLARGTLTGALSGAQTGLSGIPERFITGFNNHQHWVDRAIDIARSGTQGLA